MAESETLGAEPREGAGKGPARTLRRAGRVPAVVYGEDQPQQMISLEKRELRRALHNPRFHSTLYTLQLGAEQVRVLPREVQLHPVTDDPVHADFQRVGRGGRVTVEVPVTFVNEERCQGLRRGGVLNVVRREIELVCPADAIPEEITLDLEGFDIGDSVHISHVRLPEGVRPTITDRDFTVVTISPPSVVPAEEEEAPAGPEEAERAEKAEAAEEEGPEEEAR